MSALTLDFRDDANYAIKLCAARLEFSISSPCLCAAVLLEACKSPELRMSVLNSLEMWAIFC